MKHRAKHQPRRQSRRPTKKRRRSKLLKSACAGLLGMGLSSGAAQAFEVDEATSPLTVDGDFVDSGAGTVLPVGVTSVRGTVGLIPATGDGFDRLQWTSLAPNHAFSIVADFADNHPFFVDVPPDTAFEHSAGGFDAEGTYRGIVPIDGIVTFQVNEGEGGNSEGAYALTLSVVPEPSTGVIAAIGAAALLSLTGRKKE